MLKQLTIAFSVAALLPACVIGTDDTTSDTNNTNPATSTASAGTTEEGTTEPQTTANPTTGTTGDSATTGMTSDGDTTGSATTDVPTTDGTSGNTTGMTSGTTGQTTGETTGETTGGLIEGCGWNIEGYYACADQGGVPDAQDPLMMDPYACPDDIMEGADCDEENGPIGGVGCCGQDGANYFCDEGKVFRDDCTME